MRRTLHWWHRWFIAVGVLAVLALVLSATPARAANTRDGDNVVIGRDEVIAGDLYAAGSTVTVDGTINGDLVAIAGQVTINGTVTGDVLAGGQGVVINGIVNDDVRAAGQAVQLGPNARIGGNIAVGALSLETQANSVVSGDALIGVFQALLVGAINQDVTGGMDRAELRGVVGGNVDIDVSGNTNTPVMFSPAGQMPIPTVRPGLLVAESAQIGGKLAYRSTTTATVLPKVAGGVTFDQVPVSQAPEPQPIVPGLMYLQRLAGLVLAGLLLFWLLPRWTRKLADTVETRPLPSLGWGLVAFFAFLAAVFGVFFVMIVLAVFFGYLTLGGIVGMIISIGLLLGASLIVGYVAFVAYIAQGIVAFAVGRLLLRTVQPAWNERPFVPLIVGLLLYVAISAMPFLGGFVSLLVVLLGLGAVWQWARSTWQTTHLAPAPIGGLQPA